MRILLVEDDKHLGESLHRALVLAHYACDWIVDGDQVLSVLGSTHFDLLVMDIGLPGRSWLEVLREIRNRPIHVPVLLLTARDSIEDKVKGLDSGADDYLTKPFDLDELYARIRVLLRRDSDLDQNMLRCGNIRLDCKAREVFPGRQAGGFNRHRVRHHGIADAPQWALCLNPAPGGQYLLLGKRSGIQHRAGLYLSVAANVLVMTQSRTSAA